MLVRECATEFRLLSKPTAQFPSVLVAAYRLLDEIR